MKLLIVLILVIFTGLICGCTSLNTPQQLIYISTSPFTGANCYLENDKGYWYLPCTPGMVTVCRSNQDLLVAVKKCGCVDSYVRVKPRPLFGRMIWTWWVSNCGTTCEYPDALHLHLEPIYN